MYNYSITCNTDRQNDIQPKLLKDAIKNKIAYKERPLMIRELAYKISRFLFTLILFSVVTPYVVLTAVPSASIPGLVAASIVAALVVAMYDIGVFRVECEA
jgi:hypothetical protein